VGPHKSLLASKIQNNKKGKKVRAKKKKKKKKKKRHQNYSIQKLRARNLLPT